MITDHVWRYLRSSNNVVGPEQAVLLPCSYQNCGRSRDEHERSIDLASIKRPKRWRNLSE